MQSHTQQNKQIIINNNKNKNMKTIKTFRNLDTFAKVQLLTFGVIMLTLFSVVGQWALNGFITASF